MHKLTKRSPFIECKRCTLSKTRDEFPTTTKGRTNRVCTKCSLRGTQAKRLVAQAKYSARRAGVDFDLYPEDLEPLPECCPALGVKLVYNATGYGGDEYSASLDRVIPELGYISGNVRIISKKANRIKNNATLEELEGVLEYVRGAVTIYYS